MWVVIKRLTESLAKLHFLMKPPNSRLEGEVMFVLLLNPWPSRVQVLKCIWNFCVKPFNECLWNIYQPLETIHMPQSLGWNLTDICSAFQNVKCLPGLNHLLWRRVTECDNTFICEWWYLVNKIRLLVLTFSRFVSVVLHIRRANNLNEIFSFQIVVSKLNR